MTKYTEFDAKLLKRILATSPTFASLAAHMDADAKALAGKDGEAFRVTDRRLQELRRRGLIKYRGKTGWSAIEQPDADTPETAA